MQPDKKAHKENPTLSFHLMKFAVQDFQKNSSKLTTEEYCHVYQHANEEMLLHQVILTSEEASCVVIPTPILQKTVQGVISEYPDNSTFQMTLDENNLNFTDYVNALHNDLRVETVLAKVASAVQSVSSQEMQNYFNNHVDEFSHPEERSCSHIQILSTDSSEDDDALDLINEIHHRLSKSGDFAEEAIYYSQCESSKDGGDLGRLVSGETCPEIDRELFSLGNGEISKVIHNASGYQILKCNGIYPAKSMTFEEAAPVIETYLLKKKRLEACREWLQRLVQTTH